MVIVVIFSVIPGNYPDIIRNKKSYSRKFKKLDKLFAAKIVGDGDSDIFGPFQQALDQFFRGQVITISARWFGGLGEDFEKVIRLLARGEASGNDNGE